MLMHLPSWTHQPTWLLQLRAVSKLFHTAHLYDSAGKTGRFTLSCQLMQLPC